MADHRNRRIGRLSGGQQQRVFIARAIVQRPRILFLDEPTAGVDAETQDRFYDLLGTLNATEGITIVLVTHDIGIVNKHVNRVACLNQRLVYHGTHEEFCRSGRPEGHAGRRAPSGLPPPLRRPAMDAFCTTRFSSGPSSRDSSSPWPAPSSASFSSCARTR